VTHEVIDEAKRQLRMADEYESLSDYIVNVLKMYLKLKRKGFPLTEEARTELLDLHDHVAAYLDMINSAVEEDRREVLTKAYTHGDEVTYLMKEYRRHHLARVESGRVSPLKTLVYTDMLNSYRRMRDHGLNIAEALAGEK
jgi:phosphate:Na+ symporter